MCSIFARTSIVTLSMLCDALVCYVQYSKYKSHKSSIAVVEDAVLQPAVAAIAVQLANKLKEGISRGTVFYCDDVASSARLSTKRWQTPEPSSLHGSSRGRAAPHACRSWFGQNICDQCAAKCHLVPTVFALFQRLTAQAPQAGVIPGDNMPALTELHSANPVGFNFSLILLAVCHLALQLAHYSANVLRQL